MGQKVNPISFRLPMTGRWQSRWFSRGQSYGQQLIEDLKIRQKIYQLLGPQAGIAQIEIERKHRDTKVLIHTSKPGLLIGWQGKGIAELRAKLGKLFGQSLSVNVIEVKTADLNAQLVAANIGHQIARRLSYRRAARLAIDKTLSAGAKGIKIVISGRLQGAVIARQGKFSSGLIPLSTLKSEIDFAVYHARTSYGVIGIKVWIYKGEHVVT